MPAAGLLETMLAARPTTSAQRARRRRRAPAAGPRLGPTGRRAHDRRRSRRRLDAGDLDRGRPVASPPPGRPPPVAWRRSTPPTGLAVVRRRRRAVRRASPTSACVRPGVPDAHPLAGRRRRRRGQADVAASVGVDRCSTPPLLDGAFQLCVLAATRTATPASASAAAARRRRLRVSPTSASHRASLGPRCASTATRRRLAHRVVGSSSTTTARRSPPSTVSASCRPTPPRWPRSAAAAELYEVRWEPLPAPGRPATTGGAWLVLADGVWGAAIVANSLPRAVAASSCARRRLGPDGPGRSTLRPHDGDGLAACLADELAPWAAPARGRHALALESRARRCRRRRRRLLDRIGARPRPGARSRAGSARAWLVTRAPSGHGANPGRRACRGSPRSWRASTPSWAAASSTSTGGRRTTSTLVAELLDRLGRRRAGGGRPAGAAVSLPGSIAPVPDRAGGGPGTVSRRAAGTLDELAWTPIDPCAPGPGEVRLRVLAEGLNFRDVLVALGMYPGTPRSAPSAPASSRRSARRDGVRRRRRRVRVRAGSLATDVVVPAHFLRPVPDGVTVEQAAALPVAFLTAMYGLEQLAGIGTRHPRPRPRRRRRCRARRRAGRPAPRRRGVRHGRLAGQA